MSTLLAADVVTVDGGDKAIVVAVAVIALVALVIAFYQLARRSEERRAS